MLGNKHSQIREAVRKFRQAQTAKVLATPDPSAMETVSNVVGPAPSSKMKRKKRA
jgi:hypothetical protein